MVEEAKEIWDLIRIFLFSRRSFYIEASIMELCAYLGSIFFLVNLIRSFFTKKAKGGRPEHPQRKTKEKKWYPTGWIWNEKKQLWEPPDFMEK